jgi:hypothetical protein
MMSERLGLKRVVPAALERAVAEILTPVVERSVTIACYTTVELVAKVRRGQEQGRATQPCLCSRPQHGLLCFP